MREMKSKVYSENSPVESANSCANRQLSSRMRPHYQWGRVLLLGMRLLAASQTATDQQPRKCAGPRTSWNEDPSAQSAQLVFVELILPQRIRGPTERDKYRRHGRKHSSDHGTPSDEAFPVRLVGIRFVAHAV